MMDVESATPDAAGLFAFAHGVRVEPRIPLLCVA
jgi:hypothetical protein